MLQSIGKFAKINQLIEIFLGIFQNSVFCEISSLREKLRRWKLYHQLQIDLFEGSSLIFENVLEIIDRSKTKRAGIALQSQILSVDTKTELNVPTEVPFLL